MERSDGWLRRQTEGMSSVDQTVWTLERVSGEYPSCRLSLTKSFPLVERLNNDYYLDLGFALFHSGAC